jgi:hypothetical protein
LGFPTGRLFTSSTPHHQGATAAKVTAEKATKSAETKATKAEKALADANKKRVQ